MEQAAQAAKDQEALIELQKEQRAAKRAREADDLKRKADAELARKREDEERAALAAQEEQARNAAELERLELERQQRAAQCPFPKRPAGAVGFVREPFQTADGLIVNPWFLLH
jgi:multidrug efflux pump subunit AcrA (membrane-fusion protein)